MNTFTCRDCGHTFSNKPAKAATEQLVKQGFVRQPYVGVAVVDIDDAAAVQLKLKPGEGVLVTDVFEPSPASRANLGIGDVISSMHGQKITSAREMQKAILGLPIGQAVDLHVLRKGQLYLTRVTAEDYDIAAPAVNNVRCPRCNESWIRVTAPTAWADGDVILGEFVVERKLGQGGMGVVHLVRNQFNGRRYAVKRALVHDEEKRRQFFAELVTWQNLPEHPFIAPFRFFRTVGDEIVIFTDFVDGGTLADWIAGGKLVQLKDMLDVAIQLAWSIHTTHQEGVLHLDVKPGNALMTADGQVRLTDFGLARCRIGEEGQPNENIAVSSGGMTPAYASPEQVNGGILSRQTDLWSWGVSILDLFVGRVPSCRSGTLAPRILEEYVASGPPNTGLPRMPRQLVDILRRCFRPDPGSRWADHGEIVVILLSLYKETIGEEHTRSMSVAMEDLEESPVEDYSRKEEDLGRVGSSQYVQFLLGKRVGIPRGDPRELLSAALRADGRHAAEGDALFPPRVLFGRSQLSADLAIYDAAWRIYVRLIVGGRTELLDDAAQLAMCKASVHVACNDLWGAVDVLDEVIAIRRRLLGYDVSSEQALKLAQATMSKGNVLAAIGNNRGAVDAIDQAIGIYRRLNEKDVQKTLFARLLAGALTYRGTQLRLLGDRPGAVGAYDEAIAIYRRLIENGRCDGAASELALALTNKGLTLQDSGYPSSADAAYNEAIAIYQRLANPRQTDSGWNKDYLVEAVLNMGNVLLYSGLLQKASSQSSIRKRMLQNALSEYDVAIGFYRFLFKSEDRTVHLAKALMNKGETLRAMWEPTAALGAFDEAITIYRQLVEKGRPNELASVLANAVMKKGHALMDSGDPSGAELAFNEAVAIYRRLVEQKGRTELAKDLAKAVKNKENVLNELNLVCTAATQAQSHDSEGMCEFCGSGPTCGICGRGQRNLKGSSG